MRYSLIWQLCVIKFIVTANQSEKQVPLPGQLNVVAGLSLVLYYCKDPWDKNPNTLHVFANYKRVWQKVWQSVVFWRFFFCVCRLLQQLQYEPEPLFWCFFFPQKAAKIDMQRLRKKKHHFPSNPLVVVSILTKDCITYQTLCSCGEQTWSIQPLRHTQKCPQNIDL